MKKQLEKRFYPALFLDYRDQAPRVEGLYPLPFHHEESYRQKGAWLEENFSPRARETLVEGLRQYNLRVGASPETLANLEALARGDTAAIVTGQQPGIFTGPLYTFYKAAAAVKLAAKLREQGLAAVPVFWVSTEDHDFQEVSRLKVAGPGGWQEIRLPEDPRYRGRSLGYHRLGEEKTRSLLDSFSQAHQDTEFKRDILDIIARGARDGQTLPGWFATLMAWLFQGTGLVLFDPLLPGIKELAAPLLSSLCRDQEEIRGQLQERETLLAGRGYPLQVKRKKNHLNIFASLDRGRAALFQWGQQVVTRQGETLGTPAEVSEDILADPAKYSPGVLTRPLVQEACLPTLAYIGGPAEISYFAQLMPLFSLYGLVPPVLFPRPSLTLLEPRLARYQEKYSLAREELFSPWEAFQRYLEKQEEGGGENLFHHLEKMITEEYRRLAPGLGSINPQLAQLAGVNRQRVLQEVSYLKNKTGQALKEKHDVAAGHFRQLEEACLPGGQLQERTFNIFYYLVKYGPSFRGYLRDNLPLEPGHHVLTW